MGVQCTSEEKSAPRTTRYSVHFTACCHSKPARGLRLAPIYFQQHTLLCPCSARIKQPTNTPFWSLHFHAAAANFSREQILISRVMSQRAAPRIFHNAAEEADARESAFQLFLCPRGAATSTLQRNGIEGERERHAPE
jgi:hypothetical protein